MDESDNMYLSNMEGNKECIPMYKFIKKIKYVYS